MGTEREADDSRRYRKKLAADYAAGKFDTADSRRASPPDLSSRWIKVLFGLGLCAALLAVVAGLWPRQAELAKLTLDGEVIKIVDGDTLTLLLRDKSQVKVRLAEIDAPEPAQPWSQKSKQALAEKVFRKMVVVELTDRDQYGREVGKVFVDGENINAQMVAEGHAWVYRKYAEDPELLVLEDAARQSGLGLWAMPAGERIPPWEWRRGVRDTGDSTAAEEADPACLIKGNINRKGDRIYHVPGSRSYDATKINRPGERWFCTEEQARSAGWRPPKS